MTKTSIRPIFNIFLITIFAAVLLCSYFCIYQIGMEAKNNKDFSDLRQKLNDLSKENQSLSASQAYANSLEKISGIAELSGFEKADKIHYVRVSEQQARINSY
jgi:cell division protein FtsL